MVSVKGKKAPKRTYAERVLGALNQVQRNHRRHSVHLATLRAQVRKDAEAKKDPLGPQWSQWVGKTVHKLTQDGILENAELTGNVTLTPLGKKTISTARRTLKALPDEDDLFWKHVANASRGVKRVSDRDLEDSEGEDTSVSTLRFKRAKGNNSKVRKSKILKSSRREVSRRPSSPLTDLSDDETEDEEATRLRAELLEKNDEINQLHYALSEEKQRHAMSGPSRYATPDLTMSIDAAPSSPSPRSPRPTAPQIRRVARGITRTQSGSVIPNVSKQPTPAPSDSGGANGVTDEEEEMDTDFFALESNRPQKQLETPLTTPNRISTQIMETENRRLQERVVIVEKEMGKRDATLKDLRIEIEDLQNARRESQGLLNVKQNEITKVQNALNESDIIVTTLKSQIISLEAEIAKLSSEENQSLLNEELTQQHLATRVELQNKLALISDLELTYQELQQLYKNLTVDFSSEKEKNNHLFEQLRDIEASNESLHREVITAQDESRSFRDMKDKQDHTITELQASLEEARKEGQALRFREINLETVSQAYRVELDQTKQTVEKLNSQLNERQVQLGNLTVQLQQANSTNVEISTFLAESKAELASLDGELDANRKVAEDAKVTLGRISEELGREREQRERLMGELDEKERQLVDEQKKSAMIESAAEKINEELVARNEVAQRLSQKLLDVEEKAKATEDSLVASETRHEAERTRLIAKISNLEAENCSSLKEVESLKSQLKSTELEREETRGILVGQKAEVLKVRMELDSERKKLEFVNRDLLTAKKQVHDLEEDIVDIRSAKELDEKTIEGLKNSFEVLRDAQIRSWADMEDKVGSTYPTSIRSRATPTLMRVDND